MRDEIDVPGQAAPISHYAHAVRADGPMLFVSGVVPVDEQGRLVGGDDVVLSRPARSSETSAPCSPPAGRPSRTSSRCRSS